MDAFSKAGDTVSFLTAWRQGAYPGGWFKTGHLEMLCSPLTLCAFLEGRFRQSPGTGTKFKLPVCWCPLLGKTSWTHGDRSPRLPGER